MLFEKPNIIISKCLNFDNCRFNWDKINDNFLKNLWKYVNFIAVYPEVEIWLWTPRMPIRLYRDLNKNIRLYQPWTKTDITDKINDFSKKFLLSQENIDWFVLKNRSPSCWMWNIKVYNKAEDPTWVDNEWRIPNSSVVSMLKTWALRDKSEYILKQTILSPYPKELVELSDSGKILKL